MTSHGYKELILPMRMLIWALRTLFRFSSSNLTSPPSRSSSAYNNGIDVMLAESQKWPNVKWKLMKYCYNSLLQEDYNWHIKHKAKPYLYFGKQSVKWHKTAVNVNANCKSSSQQCNSGKRETLAGEKAKRGSIFPFFSFYSSSAPRPQSKVLNSKIVNKYRMYVF